jgi:hypothetical protein
MQGCAEVKREVNLTDVNDVLGRAGSLSCDVVSRACALADFLVGAEPTDNGKVAPPPNQSGLVHEMESRADFLVTQLHEALRLLNRAAGRLGMPPANQPTQTSGVIGGPRLARG